MAVLLDSILERLGKLEKKVENVINNGTQNLLRNSTALGHQDGQNPDQPVRTGVGVGTGPGAAEARAKEQVQNSKGGCM